MSDLHEMLATSLAKHTPRDTRPKPVKRFDWDSHVVLDCTWAQLLNDEYVANRLDFYPDYDSVVGIDIGKKFPQFASVTVEEEFDVWLATEEDYFNRYDIRWHEWEEFVPCWSHKYVTYLTTDTGSNVPTDDFRAKWVIKIPSYRLGKTGSLVEQERLRAEKRAKNEARKEAKRLRDRQIREKMKSPKKGK